jgi:hypothetical protein
MRGEREHQTASHHAQRLPPCAPPGAPVSLLPRTPEGAMTRRPPGWRPAPALQHEPTCLAAHLATAVRLRRPRSGAAGPDSSGGRQQALRAGGVECPGVRDHRALGDRARDVPGFAGMGRSNEWIGYRLGLRPPRGRLRSRASRPRRAWAPMGLTLQQDPLHLVQRIAPTKEEGHTELVGDGKNRPVDDCVCSLEERIRPGGKGDADGSAIYR